MPSSDFLSDISILFKIPDEVPSTVSKLVDARIFPVCSANNEDLGIEEIEVEN